MELPHIGQHCDEATCGQLDFLPIRCYKCGGTYCKEHSLPLHHACVEGEGKEEEEEEKEDDKDKVCISRHPCQVKGCRGGELTPIVCPKCEGNFCLSHRHQDDHNCSALVPADNSSKQEAAARVQQIANKMNSAAGQKGKGRKSDQLAAKVQLMKLKQKSTGDQGIPQSDRVYLLVFLPAPSSSSSSAVFVSRHWSLGKVVDNIATLAKLPNHNNKAGSPKLRLLHHREDCLLGAANTPLQDLLGRQAVYDGQSVRLEYMPTED